MNEVRSSGYWIIGGKSVVAKLIGKCVTCQRLRATVKDQKMADLPKERLVEPISLNQERIRAELLKENCDWFDFRFNTPKASHMGGV
jgi:hypothetical protein